MPCNCDHLLPTQHEKESIKLMNFLNELGVLNCKVGSYGDVNKVHEHTEMLCDYCKTHDVTKESLELQIWWRDHQKADAERLAKEKAKKKNIELDKQKALSKLTVYEKSILGLL